MHEPYIMLMLQLFVHLSYFDEKLNYEFVKNFVFILLRKELDIKDYDKYLELFNYYYRTEKVSDEERQNISFVKLNNICKKLTADLPLKQRIIIILYLLKFSKLFKSNPVGNLNELSNLEKAIRLVSAHFKIEPNDFDSINAFINNEIHKVSKKDNLIISGKNRVVGDIKFLERNQLTGIIKFYYIESINVFLFYLQGNDNIRLNTLEIIPYSIYFFTKSSLIIGDNIDKICFNDLLKLLLLKRNTTHIKIEAKNVSFNYKGSENGLKNFNFKAESGQLIGILGKSGSGKSTLMRLLTGNLKPATGDVTINGTSIYDKQNIFNNHIGYVPQYDTLISELTAYQNLFYYTRLWNNSLTKSEIDKKIKSLLAELELENIKHRVVGTEYQKSISGGERKRLNLALELIRDPKVLFADEPTSGLSSSDSETLIHILHEQVLNGRLIIINIHQPSSAVFKIFDKVFILDSGGYPVYFGNPLLVSETLVGHNTAQNMQTNECTNCGNINPENIFQILEEKKVDRFGLFTHERKISPKTWYSYFLKSQLQIQSEPENLTDLPISQTGSQNYFFQWVIFLKRLLLTKKNDIQYLLVSLVTSPLLAFILAILSRSSSNESGTYDFYFNKNIPSFLFISVIVALFTGLLSSAEEIHRDKLINARESILKISKNSYLLSKIVFLFFLSAVQMMLYVLVSDLFLDFGRTSIDFWLMLWMLACTSNLMGLILSSIFKSVVTIYIFIPFLLIPQILLSGTVIKYKDINQSLSSAAHVPFIGDLMPSRWAFEAISVNQFKDIQTENDIFSYDLKISNYSYQSYYLIPDLIQQVESVESLLKKKNRYDSIGLHYISSGLNTINQWCLLNQKSLLELNEITSYNLKILKILLSQKQLEFIHEIEKTQSAKENFLSASITKTKALDGDSRNISYSNASLGRMLLNVNETQPFKKVEGHYVRLFEPVYTIPENKFGRSLMFAPYKKVGRYFIETYWFNLTILIFICSLLYAILFIIYRYKIKFYSILIISK